MKILLEGKFHIKEKKRPKNNLKRLITEKNSKMEYKTDILMAIPKKRVNVYRPFSFACFFH